MDGRTMCFMGYDVFTVVWFMYKWFYHRLSNVYSTVNGQL